MSPRAGRPVAPARADRLRFRWALGDPRERVILGWVALWRPARYLPFETRERRQSRRAIERLATMPVEPRPG